jgi:alkanesulfonate monooxygenase SsuD/methylene tetrahydromethanopterin reductase-like flavin-dependent oxidoreductase (luciferase family)
MKFGINFQLQTPKPLDADQWHEHDELKIYHEALEQIEFADKLGYDYVFITDSIGTRRAAECADALAGAARRWHQLRRE